MEQTIPKHLRSFKEAKGLIAKERVDDLRRQFPPWYGRQPSRRMLLGIAMLVFVTVASLPRLSELELFEVLFKAMFSLLVCAIAALVWNDVVRESKTHRFFHADVRAHAILVASDSLAIEQEAARRLSLFLDGRKAEEGSTGVAFRSPSRDPALEQVRVDLTDLATDKAPQAFIDGPAVDRRTGLPLRTGPDGSSGRYDEIVDRLEPLLAAQKR